MKPTAIFLSFFLLFSATTAQTSSVVPPAYTNTADGLFGGTFNSAARSCQMLLNANQLTNLVGRQLKGITFRLPSTAPANWPSVNITYSNYDIYLSGSVAPAQRSLTFATNVVGPQVKVRGGSLSISASSYTTGGNPNAFGLAINFTTPYTYSGGNLLVEIRQNGYTGSAGTGTVDAASTSAAGYGTDFTACFAPGYTATTATSATSTFSIMQFNYDVVLPLTIASFNTVYQFPTALLTWTTTSERNTQYFAVERSKDGLSFAPISTINVTGIFAAKKYQFTDQNVANLNSNVVYYRLQMVDQNGSFSYSPVIALNTSHKAALVALYPNPAKDKATVSGVEAGMSVRVLDAAGKVLQVQKAIGSTESLVLHSLDKGIYNVQVFDTMDNLLSSTWLVKD